MVKKCDKCLKGAKVRTTGIDNTTLKLDIGGAVLYVTPRDGEVDVTLNAESLLDGDYRVCIWNGEQWIV